MCDSLTDIAIGHVHAARQSPYRSLALSWRVAGCEFQFPTPHMFPYLPGGRYVIIGQLGAQEVRFAPRFFVEKQLTVMGVLSGDTDHYYKALQFLQLNRDRFHFEDLLSNRYRLDQINEAMAAMHAFRKIKPVVIL